MTITLDELNQRFTYHKPHAVAQGNFYEAFRSNAMLLAKNALALPECREKALAITKLEECVMWANAAAARHWPADQAMVPAVEATPRPSHSEPAPEQVATDPQAVPDVVYQVSEGLERGIEQSARGEGVEVDPDDLPIEEDN